MNPIGPQEMDYPGSSSDSRVIDFRSLSRTHKPVPPTSSLSPLDMVNRVQALIQRNAYHLLIFQSQQNVKEEDVEKVKKYHSDILIQLKADLKKYV